jgi:hypothetical protein
MRSNDEPQESDGKHSVNHPQIPKNWFFGKRLNNMTDNTEPGKNKNIYLWVAKKSEKVLVQHWIPPSDRRKEYRFEVTVSQEHGNRPGKDRQR